MEFQLLGPFAARHGERPVLAGSRRQERCLLAILLLNEGRVVSRDRLIDLLWHGGARPSARGTLHTYVGRLRSGLRPHGPRIATRHDGYVLEPGPYGLDAREFTALLRQADGCGDPGERVRLLDRALGLWRGPLLADVADEELRARLGGELSELRLSALERRAEAHLTMGLHERVVAELAGEAERHPRREGLIAAQMTALYRGDRRADALRLYQRTHRALARELGVEPGERLRTLRERILGGDPRLDRPPAPLYAVRVGEVWLPWSAGGHPALEFCNTYAGWDGRRLPGAEWLREYATLAVWAGHMDLADEAVVAGLLGRARQAPGEAAAALDEARRFRARLRACLLDPADQRAFGEVARVVEETAGMSVFRRGEDGLGRWELAPRAGLRLPLAAAARSAAELLADPRRFLIRACPDESCGWLFLNRGGQRRWCSLATCGGKKPVSAACSPASGE